MKKYLSCALNDENYTEPYFHVYNTYKQALNEVLDTAVSLIKGWQNGSIVISDDEKRIDTKNVNGERFWVSEIKEVDLRAGNYAIVWHHAYEGVGFEVLFQGTYSECVEKRKEFIKKSFEENDYADGDNTDFNMEHDTCIDTGIEWEVYSIVKLTESEG